jgi:hypothetical protein
MSPPGCSRIPLYTAPSRSETPGGSALAPRACPPTGGTSRQPWRSTSVKGVGVKRFFFHLLKGRETVIDEAGTRLPDLAAVVSEAQRIAVRTIVLEDVPAKEWTRWKLDVKDEDGTRLFFFPFEEVSLHDVTEAKASLPQPGSTRSA